MSTETLLRPYQTMRTDEEVFAPMTQVILNYFPEGTVDPTDDQMECFMNLLMEPILEGRPCFLLAEGTKEEELYVPMDGFLREIDAAIADVLLYGKENSEPHELDVDDVLVSASVKQGLYQNEIFLTTLHEVFMTEEELNSMTSTDADGSQKKYASRVVFKGDEEALEKLSVDLQDGILEVLNNNKKRLDRPKRHRNLPQDGS
ncbi:MAG TPA: hypothetical protein PKW15_01400, partial [Alphaproteobacteria bacterium]|nr:hypothetical protein [Alphaproteobacteria bacterium]